MAASSAMSAPNDDVAAASLSAGLSAGFGDGGGLPRRNQRYSYTVLAQVASPDERWRKSDLEGTNIYMNITYAIHVEDYTTCRINGMKNLSSSS